MRALMISDDVRALTKSIVNYASKREHWYDPQDRSDGWLARLPGHNSNLKCVLPVDYRCVFSFTRQITGRVLRHLSVSVPTVDSMPHPHAVYEIAKLFDFTDSVDLRSVPPFPDDWAIHVNRGGPLDDECIVVFQDTGLVKL
jgi:hypothetical protein